MKAIETTVGEKRACGIGWRQRLFVFLLCLVPLASAQVAAAAEATLAWDPSSGSVAGYKLYYGFASRSYSSEINVGNVTQYTVTGLQDGRTYYFAVKAYDSQGNYSDYSNELECFTLTASSGAGGAISPSGTVIVSRGASKTFSITPAAGFAIGAVLVDGTSAGAVSSYTFSNVTAVHTITANFAQLANTITATAGSNGSISPSGAVQVPHGGSQGFTITPATGYKVADVKVDGTSVGAVTSYTFTNVTSARTIAASFEALTYNITASAGANGAISPAGSVTVTHGGSQGFMITPTAGYKVADVKVDGTSVGAVTSYTFTNVTASRTIAATFEQSPFYTITATAGANGQITPAGNVQVEPGGSQGFTITPATGYKVADVKVDGVSVGAVTSYTFTNVTSARTIAASFEALTYNITASAGANGTISPAGTVTVAHGGSQSFTITPATGYKVADVKVDGTSVGAVTSYTFTNVTSARTIAATFAALTYNITASAGANGAISPAGTVTVTHGGSQGFTITPAAGYKVADVKVDGVSVGAVTSYTFTNVTASRTIAATFEQSPFYTITATAGANGSITPSGTVQVATGGSQGFIMSPAQGYRIADVLVDGVSVGAVSAYTFSNVDRSRSIAVSFTAISHSIKASARAAGRITPSGDITVADGSSLTFTIAPRVGYEISDVLVDGVSVGSVSSYTFSNIKKDHMISAGFKRSGIKQSKASTIKGLYSFRDRKIITSNPLILAGTGYDPGFGGWVDMVAPGGDIERSIYIPWPEYIALSGEIRLAVGDLDGDGTKEIVVGLGPVEGVDGIPGGYFAVLDQAYNLKAWGLIPWEAYNSMNGESRPACGDLDADGKDEIVIGLGPGGEGRVAVFKFENNAVNHVKWLETGWQDYNALNGEIRPACADLDGDGKAEIVLGLGRVDETSLAPDGMYLILSDVLKGTSGSSGTDVAGWGKIEWPDYNAVNGELWPARADVNGDGKDEIVLGLGLEGGGRFTVLGFDLAANRGSHMAWQQTTWPDFHRFGVEVRPAGGNLDYDKYDEIVIGFGAGSKGFLETFDDALRNFEPIARISYVAELKSGRGVETWPAVLE